MMWSLPQSRHKASLRLSVDGTMTIRDLMTRTVGVGLLLLSGCDAVRIARDDFDRLTSPQPVSEQARKAPAAQPKARPRSTSSATTASVDATAGAAPVSPSSDDGSPVVLTGKSENELRALLGPPTSEEDRTPGKQWRYRDGQCTLDVQLYPDVQTKQFGTLAYEVKSDDNTDEGKRLCLAQLRSRVQSRQ
jgi:hypothetical protein